jgi:phospholipid/cholesterol/gamma-HCH transport system substrate-binding protein
VMSARAGLVMNPDAKVKWHGVPVGRVTSIEVLSNGQLRCTWRWIRRRCD